MQNYIKTRRWRAAAASIAVVVAVAVALTSAGCGGQLADPASAEELDAARPLYVQNCSRCHQADGGGYRDVYPALDGNQLVTLEDPQPMLDIILEGRGGMPAFRGSLTADEIAQIATYIRGAWGNDARAITTTEVR